MLEISYGVGDRKVLSIYFISLWFIYRAFINESFENLIMTFKQCDIMFRGYFLWETHFSSSSLKPFQKLFSVFQAFIKIVKKEMRKGINFNQITPLGFPGDILRLSSFLDKLLLSFHLNVNCSELKTVIV